MPILLFGTIRSFEAATQTARVEITGYPDTVLERVPVAWHVIPDLPADGARCVIAFDDSLHRQDAAVVALFGGE